MAVTVVQQKLARFLRLALPILGACLAVGVVACGPEPGARQDLEALLQSELDALHREYGFPGATAALVLEDGTAVTAATGLADKESGRAMTPSSRMLAASIGKTFVAASVLALADDGRVDLDERVAVWLGEEDWFDRLPNHESITVRHLLTHTSGISNHVEAPLFAAAFAEKWPEAENSLTPRTLVEFVLDRAPLFAPGSDWSYTDTGYVLLGMIVEKVVGRSYYEELNERFLSPLELKLTSPSDKRELSGLATGYMDSENAFGLPETTTDSSGRMHWNPAIEWTGGGLVSNSLDLARWGKLLFEGRALDGDYLDQLLRAVAVDADNGSVRYGAGVSVHLEASGGTWYGHSGWIPGYTSTLRYYVEENAAMAFQINTDIGIVDDSTDLFDEMALRLERMLIATGAE